MYTVKTVYQRPVSSIPYFGGTAEGAVVAKRFNDLANAAPGYVGVTYENSDDKLTSTSTYSWESKKAYDNFVAANKKVFDADAATRKAYNDAHGITRQITKG